MNPLHHRLAAGLALIALLLAGCERGPLPAQGPQYAAGPARGNGVVYRLAVHPLHNPQKLTEAYQPLVDYLNRNIEGARFALEASRDYQAYEAKFRAREPALLLANPWQTLEAMKAGYGVIAMAGDAEDFKGIFIVRRDSPIKTAVDLKGKTVSCPSPTALAACIMPQQFLHDHGLDINKDTRNLYVGSQESSIMNVYLRRVDAGASWPPPWRAFQKDHPNEAAELKVIWETPHLINNSVMVRNDLPAALRARVQQLLLGLSAQPEGQAILAGMETRRFHPADDAAYEPVRSFIRRFEQEVRPVEQQ
ncbi:MAG: phosphate/phosphite/phosphonate ABC transporter substrate-binding protein [Hydrogenophilaceae bacterium]|nr:phosphate/phosphite/phosphonate ABC transporter substrate-binding protein [Hydrogenophilaceae bacterium]